MPCSEKSFLGVTAYLSIIYEQSELRLLSKIVDEKYASSSMDSGRRVKNRWLYLTPCIEAQCMSMLLN